MLFIGLIGAALLALVRDLPGPAARVCRVAAGAFVVLYGAGEAVLGVAVGVLVRRANGLPDEDRAPTAQAIQALWDDPVAAHLIPTTGAVAWVVAAVVAAAIAFHLAGAPWAVPVLLVLSSIVVLHGPPLGPVGLLCFAAAVPVLAVSRRPVAAVTR